MAKEPGTFGRTVCSQHRFQRLAMIRFGFLALLFSVCLDCVSSQKPCDGVLGQQFRPDPADCRVYYLCGQGKDWRLQCGPNTVWSQEIGACVPVGSPEDTCTQSRHFLVLQLKVKVFLFWWFKLFLKAKTFKIQTHKTYQKS